MIRQGCIVFFYVDDIVVAYRKTDQAIANHAIRGLKAKYELTGGHDLQWFLGIEVHSDRSRRLIWLAQTAYIERIINLTDPGGTSRPSTTPMAPGELLPFDGLATTISTQKYQRKIGSLLYAAIITRPDIAWRANKQDTVTTSTTEAELLSMAQGAKEGLFM